MNKAQLERHQVWIYLAAILAGMAVGSELPGLGKRLDAPLWAVLGLLLFATFSQVPLTHLPRAFRDGRFIAAVVLGNFVLIPLMVWGLLQFLPSSPALQLGVTLVLLVPCTDWFITFAQLGRGDAHRAIAITPINLLLQLALLPAYLWLFFGDGLMIAFDARTLAGVVIGLLLLPLLLAWLTQRAAEARKGREAWLDWLGWWPVPLLAVVLFLVAASQFQAVDDALGELGRVALVFVAYLFAAAALGWILARLFSLPATSGRALTFTFGTRNSFMVLPLALALPPAWEIASVVIVLQSMVELFGMLVYLAWIPQRLFPDLAR